ncbi:ABC transporter permease [Candidatus Saccharibacteria bacterium]|nr:ABC transporter permease [Candidatus Saccharibacteria bacterium]
MLSYRLAHASLKSHRLRTVLTSLGVMIGVFIISLILIVSRGLHQSITDQVSALSDNIVVVRGSSNDASGLEAFSPLTAAPISSLTDRDVVSISGLKEVEAVAPMMFLGGQIKGSEGDYQHVTTVATSDNFPNIFDLKLASGNWFEADETAKQWVILGDKLARGLLGTTDASGQIIEVKGQNFTVIGVLKRVDRPISLAGVDIDKAAFISLKNGLMFSGGVNQIGQIAVRAKSADNLPALEKSILSVLDKNHLDHNEYSVRAGRDAVGALSSWLNTITTAALIFAGVSLVVGGIGIMNIMLVSVTERIREIGIRKAVGATRRHILSQFLIEALLITLYGGVTGLALAYGTAYLITLQFSLPLVYDWWIFAVGLGVPLSVGLLFGLWPAARAARQDPIVALKHLA